MEPPKTLFDGLISIGTIAVLVGLLVSVITIVSFFRKNARENAEDANRRTDVILEEVRANRETADGRLVKIETRIADFMPRAEIEAKIEHEKNNRVQAQDSLYRLGDKNAANIGEMQVALGKVEQRALSMESVLAEMKALIKDLSREVNSKLDKQQECLNTISRSGRNG